MEKPRAISFAVIFFLMLLLWILLAGLALEELIAGSAAAFIVSAITSSRFSFDRTHPKRFIWLLAYVPYYIYAEILAHLEVMCLVLTGKIKPGIVEIDNPHKSEFGTTALANSITMTPGTLTLETRPGKLYIHWIRVKKDKKQISSGFERFLLKVWP